MHDRVQAGEMPPKDASLRPSPAERSAFLSTLAMSITTQEKAQDARQGRATQRRLNAYEYENALRDLLHAPWLQIRGQFPDDGEAFRFNKVGEALDVSHVHLARYLTAADYALREVIRAHEKRTQPQTQRYYARDQKTLTNTFTQNPFNTSPDRQCYPVLGSTAQPDVRNRRAPLTDPATREQEAVGWVSSNYVTGFTYRWDQFKAPVAGRYRVSFRGYTLWAAPGGTQRRFTSGSDKVGTPGKPRPDVPDYDKLTPGRTVEPITVYTRNGTLNRRVGAFDLTPEPTRHEIGEVWLVGGETLVPDASRFYRSRPPAFKNPLMTKDGCPSVAFQWMEVEGPLNDESSDAGYQLLFGGDQNPERLLRRFLSAAYRGPVDESDLQRFFKLYQERQSAGLSTQEALLATYTAVLASPRFLFLQEKPGPLDDRALATRLALFLWNSTPDATLRERATQGTLHRPDVLRAETERLLNDPKAHRFTEAFLDYWLDLRKIEDSTPSTTLYNDYYLDDALVEAAMLESHLTFEELVRQNLPARNVVDANFIFTNERLATHYGLPEVKGVAMRRVTLPPNSPRGGFLTQASVLKVTANGTTTSPVLRGKWVMERILGYEVPPPPPVPAVEPDIRGAVTIRQQLDKHRADPSCASCHSKIDPPGFALESFDVMGAWRERYRGIDETKPPEKGIGKNGQAFAFHQGLPVDCSGKLSSGTPFTDVRDLKHLLAQDESPLARNLAKQLVIYATGAPIRFSDRAALEKVLTETKPSHYGVRSLLHAVVQSELFRQK
ncbi:DUF1592 domain-containing protein [Armatimonas rosea]|uniref:DUF1592 domain-containing protein n=1 Tax=Armatimonas rosea TaxID=685828 RepID=A0A7W9SVU1_ARMRO|nr:DUF1592 domain-containing protein [Armatimonas rosea]MBB6052903.1 hypothetical protein [Armatimonas rosea]